MNDKRIAEISGTVSLTEHQSEKYDKHIYIFGDRHTQSKCPPSDMPVSDFLALTIDQNKDKVVDIFVEVPFLAEKKEQSCLPGEDCGTFHNLGKKFWNCLKKSKKDCPYKNLRMHYSDVRNIGFFSRLETIYFNLKYYTQYIDSDSIQRRIYYTDQKMLRLIEEYKTLVPMIQSLGNTDFFLEKIIKIDKINKQIENIEEIEVKQAVLQYIKNLLEKNKLPDLPNITLELSIENITKLNDFLVDIIEYNAIFMDTYLLARLFRTFSDSSKTKHIIVYTGNFHSENYRKFLDELGFVRIAEKYNEENSLCLSLTNFEQPFFHGKEIEKKDEYCQNDYMLIYENIIYCLSRKEFMENKVEYGDIYFYPGTVLEIRKSTWDYMVKNDIKTVKMRNYNTQELNRKKLLSFLQKGGNLNKIPNKIIELNF